MDPVNRIETSAMTLIHVEQNSPSLTQLAMTSLGGAGDYWPNDSADLARFGDAIGANTNLLSLIICGARELSDMAANNGPFFEGLNRNSSINNLCFTLCDLSPGMGREILNEFVANNSNLTGIILMECTLGNRGDGVLLSAVTSCTSLNSIRLMSCNIDDDILEEFVSGIRGLPQLRTLDLSENNFGRAGCEALATMLQDPNLNLRILDLDGNNRIDDICATILANSLKGNRKLESLVLSGNGAITDNGWDAFSQVLCNTSSVNNTYLSNHTLQDIGDEEGVDLPVNLSSLLELNRVVDKKQVAIQKILRHHAYLDMEPFFEWHLKVLPLAVSWFDRARESVLENGGAHVDTKKLSAIYQFAKALPLMFVPSPNKATAKRKISEIN